MTRLPMDGQLAHPPLRPGAHDLLTRTEGSLARLNGATDWFNTVGKRKPGLSGKVTLVNFWTYSCINSLRPLPYLKSWSAQYKNDGLTVIGVHTPEFSFEKQRLNVEWALREFDIAYPVVSDNDYGIWQAFGNEYWPAFFLFDGNGRSRYQRFGEGQYDTMERSIRALLKENGAAVPMAHPSPVTAAGIEAAPGRHIQTPETYVGYRRAERFSSPERLGGNSRRPYTAPAELQLNNWALRGAWDVGGESGLLREPHGKLVFRFYSRDLHLVAGPHKSGNPIPFRVSLDGAAPGGDAGLDCASDGTGEVRQPRLYQLVRQKGQVRDRLFEIEFLDSGVRAYSFTFG